MSVCCNSSSSLLTDSYFQQAYLVTSFPYSKPFNGSPLISKLNETPPAGIQGKPFTIRLQFSFSALSPSILCWSHAPFISVPVIQLTSFLLPCFLLPCSYFQGCLFALWDRPLRISRNQYKTIQWNPFLSRQLWQKVDPFSFWHHSISTLCFSYCIYCILLLYWLTSFLQQDFPSGGSDVKSLPTMWETQVPSLGQEDPLEKGMSYPH